VGIGDRGNLKKKLWSAVHYPEICFSSKFSLENGVFWCFWVVR